MFGFGDNDKKMSTESYKGVRDFYPEDQALQNYIFKVMREVAEAWGYVEYGASVLEPFELYKSKTSEEIVNGEMYTFKDRGDREVSLRPEMTPTVARMIAGRLNEIPMPARWYSIPNLFRYEKPQRGRLREHWQLNVDIFGTESPYADAEIISLASDIMKKFGAALSDFEIRVNSRALMNTLYKNLGISSEKSKVVSRIIDKKEKIRKEAFNEAVEKELGDNSAELLRVLESKEGIFELLGGSPESKRLLEVIAILEKRGLENLVFNPALTRGFDYYTGMVFEVFDTGKENPRSLFGGGRYDNLISAFSNKGVPAVGFGMGDVTIRDFLYTHNLFHKSPSTTEVWIAVAPETDLEEVYRIGRELREKGVKVGIDISGRKLGDQIASAEKRKISFVVVVGNDELKSGVYKIRNMERREEKSGSVEEIIKCVK